MTIAELILELQKYPQDMKVVVLGERGYWRRAYIYESKGLDIPNLDLIKNEEVLIL